MTTSALLLGHADGVLTITLNRPDKLNPLDLPRWEELAEAFARPRRRDPRRGAHRCGARRLRRCRHWRDAGRA